MWLYAMVMKMIEDEKHNNVVTNDSNVVVIGNEGVFVNGKKYPLPNHKCSPSTVINNRIFIDGYELKGGKWKKTPRAVFHKYF